MTPTCAPNPSSSTTETWKWHVDRIHFAAANPKLPLHNYIQAAMRYARDQGAKTVDD
jgi:hypothetical protein